MRILIQHRTTQQFLRADGRWTADPREAITFRISAEALLYCRENKVRDAQLWFEFEGEEHTFAVPVRCE